MDEETEVCWTSRPCYEVRDKARDEYAIASEGRWNFRFGHQILPSTERTRGPWSTVYFLTCVPNTPSGKLLSDGSPLAVQTVALMNVK